MQKATRRDGQARLIQADACGLERVELVLLGQGHEEEHRRDQHDDGQALVERAGQPVE